MIIRDNKIVECTDEELFDYYLKGGYCEFWSYSWFKSEFKCAGCVVIE